MKSVLVIRLSSLGDVVLSTVAIDVIKRNFPDSSLYFLTKDSFLPLFKGLIEPDKIFAYPDTYAEKIQLIRKINAIGFDCIVDLHRITKTILFTAFLRAPNLYTSKRSIQRRMIVRNGRKGDEELSTIVSDHIKAFIPLGIDASIKYIPKLAICDAEKQYARGLGISDRTIIIHPGAKWKLKCWLKDYYSGLSEMLCGLGYDVISLEDIGINKTRFLGKLTLRELIGVLSQSCFFVGNDSGPMHIASALGVPLIGIFGPTHPVLGFAPQGEKSMVISADFPCSPCSLHGEGKCKRNGTYTGDCMLAISPEMIFSRIERFLKDGSF
jgi:ADP-heptose:LPS heptosyltransferase